MSETINQRVKKYRKLSNLTQREVSEKLDMKEPTYSQMERKGSISADMIKQLAELFGISTEALLYDTSQSDNPFGLPVLTGTRLYEPSPLLTHSSDTGLVLSKREENIIKILKNLPRKDRDEVIAFIEEKYKKNK